ncbi:Glycoside hydrolase family 5 protein [Mycena indigotica]|uniref:glucan 1,3-beta-glucosidase n=1 Tax=Mycena indigotica TaxID=2126181 RepID=A0A8H6SLM4_9AGAR|nr:Glycoside hydrolase family 5 protein [Mycena indigotica]KAF7301888.1 Glycoside hydrolase family 5 protein [Mycena indigotica]
MSSTPLRSTPEIARYESPAQPHTSKPHRSRRRLLLIIIPAGLLVIVAIVLGVFFGTRANHSNNSNDDRTSTGTTGTPGSGNGGKTGATTGGDGSIVTTESGAQFRYNNTFGGFWVSDPKNPFNNNAQPNSWTPPLNKSWTWGQDRVYGVNLGGLFVLEPFITPSLFERYAPAADEWTLSVAMANDTANGGLGQLETHYDTFVTEQDFAEMAGAGINFIRIPIPYWAIETWEGEPFLAKTSWKYFLRVLDWARKYGLRVCLDLHTVPAYRLPERRDLITLDEIIPGQLSQRKYVTGIANAQRTLYYIRVLTEFISQPAYRDLIPIFGIVNEALLGVIGKDQLTSFYLEAHNMIRDITGRGAGNGAYIAIHDGFQSLDSWAGFLQGSDRIMLDTHPYFSFGGIDTSPINVNDGNGNPGGKWPTQACAAWGPSINTSQTDFGVTIAGEWAASPNDCGFFLRGVGPESTNPDCPDYDDYLNYSESMKAGIANYVLASMDATHDWFFWTWKIGPKMDGTIGAPLWSYQLGLREGWIPRDPRTANGKCAALGQQPVSFDGTYEPWMTGGTTSTIAASSTASFPYPPTTISNVVVPLSLMPTFTSTAPIITMPPQTFTAAPSSVTASVVGWFDSSDTTGGVTAVAGCTYPDAWNGIFSTTPTAPCTGPTS